MEIDNVFWKRWNDAGHSIIDSKSHRAERNSDNTLCGIPIPVKTPGFDVEGGYGGNGYCKRCQKIESLSKVQP